MKTNRTLLPVLMLAFVLTSCEKEASENVNQDIIWTSYQVEFNADDNVTNAIAQFRVSHALGTILELTAPANVKSDGDNMSYSQLYGHYKRVYTGVNEAITFTYTDLDNEVFVNELTIPASIELVQGVTTINRSVSQNLDWFGDPLQDGEVVTVYIRELNGTDFKVFSTSQIGATSVYLDDDQLSGLNNGPATLQFERVRISSALDEPGTGSLVTEKFLSEVANITLE